MSLEEIEVGKTYKIEIDDCCAWGSFTSKLVSIDEDEMCTFENGVVIGGWGVRAVQES